MELLICACKFYDILSIIIVLWWVSSSHCKLGSLPCREVYNTSPCWVKTFVALTAAWKKMPQFDFDIFLLLFFSFRFDLCVFECFQLIWRIKKDCPRELVQFEDTGGYWGKLWDVVHLRLRLESCRYASRALLWTSNVEQQQERGWFSFGFVCFLIM